MGMRPPAWSRSAQTLTAENLPRWSRLEILTLVVPGSETRRSALAVASSSVLALQRDTRASAWPAKYHLSIAYSLSSVMRT